MRVLIPALLSLFITACASTPSTNSRNDVSESSLKPGECGLYGWSTDSRRDFIFFADKDTARYNGPTGPVDLAAQSAFPSLNYIDEAGNPVSLRLGEGETMAGGMRFPSARIVTTSEDGWERLQPVALIQGCPGA